MAYTKTVWVNDTTPAVNATNLNKIEQGIFDAATTADGAIQKSVVTTKGDVLVATASGTITRVGVGTDGQVLTAASGQASGVQWTTPATGGVSSTRLVSTGTGLTGGGDLSADRTIAFASVADQRVLGNVSGSSAAPIALTAAQIKTFLALAVADVTNAASAINGGGETVATNATATGAVTVNAASGNYHALTLTGNVTSMTISNPSATGKTTTLTLEVKQDATGSRTVVWPTGTKWAAGTAPTLSTAANAIDVVTLISRDGGTSWLGFLGGKAFA